MFKRPVWMTRGGEGGGGNRGNDVYGRKQICTVEPRAALLWCYWYRMTGSTGFWLTRKAGPGRAWYKGLMVRPRLSQRECSGGLVCACIFPCCVVIALLLSLSHTHTGTLLLLLLPCLAADCPFTLVYPFVVCLSAHLEMPFLCLSCSACGIGLLVMGATCLRPTNSEIVLVER